MAWPWPGSLSSRRRSVGSGWRARRWTPPAVAPAAPRPRISRPQTSRPRTRPRTLAPPDGPPDVAAPAARPADEHVDVWALVERAQRGDGDAFGLLYDRYVDTVYRFVLSRVNDRALAEDFTSETFLRALRRIGAISYQGRDVGAWFITIARNIVFDHSKSARHNLEVTTAEITDGPGSAPDPEAALLDAFATSTLVDAIRRLNAEQRECVTLRFLHGLSVSETAAAMGRNDGAVKALQHRAVKKLAELVGDSLR